jgi:hypothetical protein
MTILAGLLALDAAEPRTTPRQRRELTAIWTNMTSGSVDRRDVEPTVRSALAPLGVVISWRASHGLETSGPSTVRVVLIHSRPSALHPNTMGSSNPGSTSPTIWVQYDQVLRVLRDSEGAALLDRSRLGVAIGRVISHEFVHLLAPGRSHDATGLFAARLDGSALVAPHTRLSETLVQWFQVDSTSSPLAAGPEDGPVPSVEASREDGRRSQGETLNVPVIDGWIAQ